MGLEQATKDNLLKLLLQNVNFANIGDATGLRGSSVAGNFYVSLHTASPAGGDQTTSEASYTGYARVPVVRSASGWAVAGGIGDNVAAVVFGTWTGGPTTSITHVGLGTASSGAGVLLGSVPMSNGSLAMGSNVTPRIEAGNLDGCTMT